MFEAGTRDQAAVLRRNSTRMFPAGRAPIPVLKTWTVNASEPVQWFRLGCSPLVRIARSTSRFSMGAAAVTTGLQIAVTAVKAPIVSSRVVLTQGTAPNVASDSAAFPLLLF